MPHVLRVHCAIMIHGGFYVCMHCPSHAVCTHMILRVCVCARARLVGLLSLVDRLAGLREPREVLRQLAEGIGCCSDAARGGA